MTAVFNPPAGAVALYTNGTLAGINNAVTVRFSSVSNVLSYIGRSLYSGDPYPDFTLNEFRLYNGALSAPEIAATQVLGPDQLLSTNGPVMSTTTTGSSLTLAWPVNAAGYTVMTTTNLAGANWSPATLTPQINGRQWQVTLPLSGNQQFYQLQK